MNQRHSAIEDFRAALEALPPHCSTRDLATAVAGFAHAARDAQLPPESFLMSLKDGIITLAPLDAQDMEHRAELMHDSVSLAINEYYAERAD